MFNNRTRIKALLAMEPANQEITVMGWVRTFRNNQFIALNDGSTNNNLQVVVELGLLDDATLKRITTGASLKITGELVASLGKGQTVELKAKSLEVLGDSDAEAYPLQPKKHSLEFLREKAHLRFRTNTFGAVFRVRHSLAFAIHQFFHQKGFVYLHTPIITASDAEGAGEMFRVTTLNLHDIPFESKHFDECCKDYALLLSNHINNNNLEAYRRSIEEILQTINKIDLKVKEEKSNPLTLESLVSLKSYEIERFEKFLTLTENSINKRALNRSIRELKEALIETGFFQRQENKIYLPESIVEKINPSRRGVSAKYLEKKSLRYSLSFYNYIFILKELKSTKDRSVVYKEDFFGKSTNLTVSGQLEGELGAMAFSEIYTFGPTFRAENSNTTRHLAEFWMIEPEMAFYDIEDNMNLAEEFIKYIIRFAMDNNRDDLEFLSQRLAEEEKALPQDKRSELGLIEKLEFVLNNAFERITYTEAIDILLNSPAYKKKKFQYDIKWGIDLQSEHERYLVEKHFKKPVIVTNYPAAIKAFYMRLNDGCEEGKQTVAAMDILAPGIGEIVGGSQREERLENLLKRMEEFHIPAAEMDWYLDTRRFGTVPHAGFGLGFERMVQFVTGMTNIRDVIAFARTPKNCEF